MKYLVDNREYMPVINDDGSYGPIHAHLTKMDEDGTSHAIHFETREEAEALALRYSGDASAVTPLVGLMAAMDTVESKRDDNGEVIFDQRPEPLEDNMADTRNYLIENTAKLPVIIAGEPTGPVLDYITTPADKDLSVPVAFSQPVAEALAEEVGGTAVPVPPEITHVHLDRSARKLPTTEATLVLEQQVQINM